MFIAHELSDMKAKEKKQFFELQNQLREELSKYRVTVKDSRYNQQDSI